MTILRKAGTNRIVWDITAHRAEQIIRSMEGRGLAPVEVQKLKDCVADIKANPAPTPQGKKK